MFAIRNLIRGNGQIVKKVVQQRNMSAVSVPPRNRISRAEMLTLSAAMIIGWSIIPAWVLVNIKNYRHHD